MRLLHIFTRVLHRSEIFPIDTTSGEQMFGVVIAPEQFGTLQAMKEFPF